MRTPLPRGDVNARPAQQGLQLGSRGSRQSGGAPRTPGSDNQSPQDRSSNATPMSRNDAPSRQVCGCMLRAMNIALSPQ